MSTFKKTKVVLLTTNEKASLKLGQNGLLVNNTLGYDSHFTNQHLYFLSDEAIKEGDWYIHNQKEVGLRVQKCIGTNLPMDAKKIIATTDKNLKIITGKVGSGSGELLPQPSQLFIEKFVDEYNKGNVITEVMVEYEEGKYNLDELRERHLKGLPHSYDYCNLKINPKDNTITIRKIKDSWSREEVKVILEKAIYEREQFLNKSGTLSYNFDKWIEENL